MPACTRCQRQRSKGACTRGGWEGRRGDTDNKTRIPTTLITATLMTTLVMAMAGGSRQGRAVGDESGQASGQEEGPTAQPALSTAQPTASKGGRRAEGPAQPTARLQRQRQERAKEDRGPSPVHCLFAKTDPERERERAREEQGPARSAQHDGRERAQGGRGLSLVFKSRTDVAEKASKGDRER